MLMLNLRKIVVMRRAPKRVPRGGTNWVCGSRGASPAGGPDYCRAFAFSPKASSNAVARLVALIRNSRLCFALKVGLHGGNRTAAGEPDTRAGKIAVLGFVRAESGDASQCAYPEILTDAVGKLDRR
jgi:hypothetical protein